MPPFPRRLTHFRMIRPLILPLLKISGKGSPNSKPNTALVVLFLIAGGWLAGLPGMFYAIPAALSLRAALRALRDARLRI